MIRATVDIAYEDDEKLAEVIGKIERDFQVKIDVIQEISPSGWPEVTVTGTYRAVYDTLEHAWGMPPSEILELCEVVE
jgi:hypothetical protein